MAELVSEDVISMWGLKTHGLMKDGEDQQVHRPGLLATACRSPRRRAAVVSHIFLLLGTYGIYVDLGSNLRWPAMLSCWDLLYRFPAFKSALWDNLDLP